EVAPGVDGEGGRVEAGEVAVVAASGVPGEEGVVAEVAAPVKEVTPVDVCEAAFEEAVFEEEDAEGRAGVHLVPALGRRVAPEHRVRRLHPAPLVEQVDGAAVDVLPPRLVRDEGDVGEDGDAVRAEVDGPAASEGGVADEDDVGRGEGARI